MYCLDENGKEVILFELPGKPQQSTDSESSNSVGVIIVKAKRIGLMRIVDAITE